VQIGVLKIAADEKLAATAGPGLHGEIGIAQQAAGTAGAGEGYPKLQADGLPQRLQVVLALHIQEGPCPHVAAQVPGPGDGIRIGALAQQGNGERERLVPTQGEIACVRVRRGRRRSGEIAVPEG
jgi:hypothetical protein